MFENIEIRLKQVEPCSIFLYYSCHFFLMPVFLSIYMNRYDVLWISTSALITSLLRWGNPSNIWYQYIDHNWVKMIFVYIMVSWVDLWMEQKYDGFDLVYLLGLLLSIVYYFAIEWFVFVFLNPYVGVVLHMLVHFFSIIGMTFLLHFDYDFNTRLYLLGQQAKQIIFGKEG